MCHVATMHAKGVSLVVIIVVPALRQQRPLEARGRTYFTVLHCKYSSPILNKYPRG